MALYIGNVYGQLRASQFQVVARHTFNLRLQRLEDRHLEYFARLRASRMWFNDSRSVWRKRTVGAANETERHTKEEPETAEWKDSEDWTWANLDAGMSGTYDLSCSFLPSIIHSCRSSLGRGNTEDREAVLVR